MWLLIGFLILAVSVLLLYTARRRQQSTGLPVGRVIHADASGWQRLESPLYDAAAGLTGRPDYLVQQSGQIIPVEVKSGASPTTPHEGHIYQLAAYCYLVERTYKNRPAYGILRYADRTFAIEYTPALESSLLDLLTEMRACARDSEVQRSHTFPARCQACGYRSICDQKID